MDRETYDKNLNDKCLNQILAHWHKLGFDDIKVTTERVPILHDIGVWTLRSNLRNALPPRPEASP